MLFLYPFYVLTTQNLKPVVRHVLSVDIICPLFVNSNAPGVE